MRDIQVFKELTAVDPNSATPLYLQIRDGLGQWLAMYSIGQQIPPERELADALVVNRATVKKAMAPFVEDGTIVRRPKRGTILVKPIVPDEPRPHPFNGAANMTFAPVSTVPLSIVLFENLPPQQQVWNAVVDQFNQDHPAMAARIEWLPESVCTLELYRTFIRKKQPDVVLVSSGFARDMQREDILLELPPDLTEDLRGESYCPWLLGPDGCECLEHVVPVQMTNGCFLWNEALAGPEPPHGWPTPSHAQIVDWLLRVSRRIPSGALLTVNTRYLPLLAGVPMPSAPDAAVADFFGDTFTDMARLRGCYPHLHWPRPPDRYGYRAQFVKGKAAVFVGGMSQIVPYLSAATFPWRAGLALPKTERYMATDWNGMAAPANGRNPGAALEFLRYMASPRAQDLVAGAPINVPYHRGSQRHLIASFYHDARPADIEASVRCLRGGLAPWASFVCDRLDFLRRDVAQGKQTVTEAVAAAMALYREDQPNIESKSAGVEASGDTHGASSAG